MITSPFHLKDWYKAGHKFQYPADTTLIYSNATCRGSRLEGVDEALIFGPQFFVKEYLVNQFNDHFFSRTRQDVLNDYQRRCRNAIGPLPSYQHVADLHNLGYLPIQIKALPEGTLCPMRVPYLTIRNTRPEFFWLTNDLETLLSAVVWGMINSATIAFQYRKVFEAYAAATGGPKAFVPWQGHDFSMRGMFGIDAAITSGMAHLLSFTGTDTIPAIDALEEYYGANSDHELVGGSVPATEHSVMCMGGQDGELSLLRRLITEVYPQGVVSIVSDTWDFWKLITEYLPTLKPEIMARSGGMPVDRVVIRPDSGDPVKIICGTSSHVASPHLLSPEGKGAIQCLWETFGGTINAAGFKELDSHIGLIYGDSITLERQKAILQGLKQKGFASTNVVFGIGSYTYQMNTRDPLGQAIKATYGETRSGGPQPIFKKPKTDDGLKNSAKGLLCVQSRGKTKNGLAHTGLNLREDVTWADESTGLLQTIFRDGQQENIQTLAHIRARIEDYLLG